MAIQPIDLQTLFTQIDKVGKEQINQKEGVHLQAALQGVQIQRKTDERDHSVNETRDAGEGAERIKDQNARRQGGEHPSGRQPDEKDPDESGDGDSPFIRDPALGKNIDISG
jgi:tRNA U54 and U55 pseudouridine synthase Pus10